MSASRSAPLARLDLTAMDFTGEQAQPAKRLADVAHLYADTSGVDLEQEAYRVAVFARGDLDEVGNLFVGMSILAPLDVNGEFNMTRGHFHKDPQAAEYYVGMAGRGLLLLVDKDGNSRYEEVTPGSVHYISGREGHRLVNTSDEELRVFAVWPTTAGYDYTTVEQDGFGVRVFRSGDSYVVVEQ